MKVIHSFFNETVEKDIEEDCGFLLSNNIGGYLSLSDIPKSRYHGWFSLIGNNVTKIIENIEVIGGSRVDELKNILWRVERRRGDLAESFFVPLYHNSLVYELSRASDIALTLDIRPTYEGFEDGGPYEVLKERDVVVLKSAKNNNIFLAIKSDIPEYSGMEEILRRFYPMDRKRNSPPFEKDIYKVLKLKGRKIVFSVADSKEAAIGEVRSVFVKTDTLKTISISQLKGLTLPPRNLDKEKRMAFFCSQNSIGGLLTSQTKTTGIIAGLPWFFQFWTRDEAISANFFLEKRFNEIKEIIFRQMNYIRGDGRIPNKFPAGESCADGAGWLFKLVSDSMYQKKQSILGSIFNLKYGENEIIGIRNKLEETIEALIKYQTDDNLAKNSSGETWMDTLDRGGARIEIQALRLKMYQLALKMTRKDKYADLIKKSQIKILERFCLNNVLADGLEDFTIRPNIFLAAYIYPELFRREDWIMFFQSALEKLWLDWGGIATIDRSSIFYCRCHTGEDPTSYHNGDSWYFINNLTALVLFQFGKMYFSKYIEKLMRASTEEILWKGIVGHHGELSSAEKFDSEGSWVQAWSSALYIEAVNKIYFGGENTRLFRAGMKAAKRTCPKGDTPLLGAE